MNTTRRYIALVLTSYLVKQDPCEISQKQILHDLETVFELKISRSCLNYNMAALKSEGYVESKIKGNPHVTVYKMTDKLNIFFQNELERYTELEEMIAAQEEEGVE